MSRRRTAPHEWGAPGVRALLRASVLVCSLALGACIEQPVVRLGYQFDTDGAVDEDGSIDEQLRERQFIEIARKECRENEPVCGSDGQTYRNICHALGSGVEEWTPGAC